MCKVDEQQDNQKEEAPILEVKGASYTYDGEKEPVWENLSCQFYEGKIHAIAGPSGCGKSSVLYLLDGMIPHTIEGDLSGEVWYDGENITDVMPRYRCDYMGIVMQNPESQFCTFTVEEELAFGLENLQIEPEQMRDRIQQVLHFVGMDNYEQTDLNFLSGGQKQKIAIASILVMNPRILLLDEPTANLDPESRAEIFDLIIRLAKEQGKTIILVEHNLKEIADQVDVLYSMTMDGCMSAHRGPQIRQVLEGMSRAYRKPHQRNPQWENKRETVLELNDVAFAYDTDAQKNPNLVLKGINLKIYKQDFVAILGENGAGKTTMLNVILQIYKQNRGEIFLYGKPVEKYRRNDLYRQIGLVFQNPENQFVTNNVMDEMMFSLKKEKIPQEEKEERVLDMLKKFHLEQEVEKSPFMLSQGQKRRLSVATMLLTGQKILFLDEPTYGQDFENRYELMEDMSKLNEQGVTIVMITHDLSLIQQYANRSVLLKDGVISEDLSTGEGK